MLTEEERKIRNREKSRRYCLRHPERVKANKAKYLNSPHGKLWELEYLKSPKYLELARQRQARWSKTPKGQAYHKQWYQKNRDRLRKLSVEYRAIPEVKERQKKTTLLRKYGKNALTILERNHYVCQKCNSSKALHIHHINWNEQNNELENLVILCNSCHQKLHGFVPPQYRKPIYDEWIKMR